MVRPTDVLHMYHDEEDDEICQINQIGRDNKAKNNACWKCGEVGHFARECPSNETKTQDRYAGKIQHTYTGSTPVTEKMWQDLMKKAINATASSMVLANKYKQMKNKVQQTQTATLGTTAANRFCKNNSKAICDLSQNNDNILPSDISYETSWNKCTPKSE